MPGCALPRRLNADGSRLSVQVILDRRNQEWIDNIGEVRCYLYPIHNSRAFLVTPSLASSLYLMVMYFITGAYQEVFKMVESCVSEDLTPEEVSFTNRIALNQTCSILSFILFPIFTITFSNKYSINSNSWAMTSIPTPTRVV
jgi:hypothetical protein